MGKNIISMEPKSRTLILVDYSNLLYRAYFSCNRDLEIRPWLPFIRLLDMLRTCVKYCRQRLNHTSVEFIFAGDSVRRKLDRMKVDENYKADRPPLTNLKFYIFRDLMQYVIADIGCEIVYRDGSEGDDVIATIVAENAKKCDCAKKCAVCKCKQPIDSIVIFSMDKDLNALLEYNNVTIYRPPSIFYTQHMFELEYGFHPKYFTIYKALVGDKSDGIKPLSRWGDSRAKIHILKGDWIESLKKDKLVDEFNHNLALLQLNSNIPDLSYEGKYVGVLSSDFLNEKIVKEYHRKDAIDDINFAEKRLEEACNDI